MKYNFDKTTAPIKIFNAKVLLPYQTGIPLKTCNICLVICST